MKFCVSRSGRGLLGGWLLVRCCERFNVCGFWVTVNKEWLLQELAGHDYLRGGEVVECFRVFWKVSCKGTGNSNGYA